MFPVTRGGGDSVQKLPIASMPCEATHVGLEVEVVKSRGPVPINRPPPPVLAQFPLGSPALTTLLSVGSVARLVEALSSLPFAPDPHDGAHVTFAAPLEACLGLPLTSLTSADLLRSIPSKIYPHSKFTAFAA